MEIQTEDLQMVGTIGATGYLTDQSVAAAKTMGLI
jgi:hypothetical protein